MKKLFLFAVIGLTFFQSCIKDDILQDMVEPVLNISVAVDTIALNDAFQFEAMYLNNVGVEEVVPKTWTSSDETIISIDANGLATGNQLGSAIITVQYDDGTNILEDAVEVHVGQNTISISTERSGVIVTTSSYTLTGDFVLKEDGDGLILEIAENYQASSSLPGLYIYLTNNPSTTSNALEIGPVSVFSGAHSYEIPNTELNDFNYVLYFCKPFNVKVGEGEISN